MTQDVLITTNVLTCFNRMYILLLLVQCFTNINVVPLLKVFKCAIVLLIFLKSTYFINYWKRGIAISNSIADLLVFHFSFIFSLLLYWSFITIYFIFPSVFSDTLIYFTDMYIWNSQRLENILLDENQLCFKRFLCTGKSYLQPWFYLPIPSPLSSVGMDLPLDFLTTYGSYCTASSFVIVFWYKINFFWVISFVVFSKAVMQFLPRLLQSTMNVLYLQQVLYFLAKRIFKNPYPFLSSGDC